MLDVILASDRARAPAECPSGCALWANLSADGNGRDQDAVNAKFRYQVPPANAGRSCAMPAYDPGESGPGWCYCKDVGAKDTWGYCLDPLGSVPEQLNLQFVDSDAGAVTLAFVTVDGHAPSAPLAQLSTSPSLAGAANFSGVTNFWVQEGSSRQYSFHFVPFSGLAPATTYYYRASSGASGAQWSAIQKYTTRDPSKPLRFAIFGDMGVYPVNNMDLLANASTAGEIAFVVHMGDHAYQMSSDDGMRGDAYMIAWESVLSSPLSSSFSSSLFLPIMGNHEEYNGAFFMRYLNQTAGVAQREPRRSSSGVLNGRWYSINVGLLHLVVLDFNVYYSSEPDALRVAQLQWLEADLSAVDRSRTPWVLVAAHMPIQCSSITYDGAFVSEAQRLEVALGAAPADVAARAPYKGCVGTGVSNTEASRRDMEPLFLRFGVDIFACGHEHNYESMWPTKDLQPVQKDFNAPRAPVYVVEGAGGAPALDLFGGPAPFTRLQDSSWGWGHVTVHNATHLTWDRVANDLCRDQCQGGNCPPCGVPAGTVQDSWTIYQPKHGPFEA
jgi:hypothetical protein